MHEWFLELYFVQLNCIIYCELIVIEQNVEIIWWYWLLILIILYSINLLLVVTSINHLLLLTRTQYVVAIIFL